MHLRRWWWFTPRHRSRFTRSRLGENRRRRQRNHRMRLALPIRSKKRARHSPGDHLRRQIPRRRTSLPIRVRFNKTMETRGQIPSRNLHYRHGRPSRRRVRKLRQPPPRFGRTRVRRVPRALLRRQNQRNAQRHERNRLRRRRSLRWRDYRFEQFYVEISFFIVRLTCTRRELGER